MSLATIGIKDLRLRTFIGFNAEEKIKKQDVILNLQISYDATAAMLSDEVEDAYNYKVLTKQIINLVETQKFNLLEKMAADIIELVKTNERVLNAQVSIDKPHALRFADSVAISVNYQKEG